MKVCIMKKEKLDVIVCPTCGCEYLPAEIYLPNSFFGKPTNIEKTREGKVETFEGMTMNPNESFICDHCGTHFNVKANITFKATVDAAKDFTTDYVSPLKEKKISLFEDFE